MQEEGSHSRGIRFLRSNVNDSPSFLRIQSHCILRNEALGIMDHLRRDRHLQCCRCLYELVQLVPHGGQTIAKSADLSTATIYIENRESELEASC
mmetsp:Transcript_39578/g.157148  ORF Transcript_39578/g.157148 Transcript_39578/m.157148 type:complete len:95 (-) Transcript_39578:488-772(-)